MVWTLSRITPQVGNIVDWDTFDAFTVLLHLFLIVRVVVFGELIWNHAFYRAEIKYRKKITLSFSSFVTDCVFAFSYGSCTIICYSLLLDIMVRLRSAVFGPDCNLIVMFLSLVVLPINTIWIESVHYSLHKLVFRHPDMFYVFHADHHVPFAQSALLGSVGEGGFWEGICRVPIKFSVWPPAGRLYGRVLDGVALFTNFFGHHYFPSFWYDVLFTWFAIAMRVFARAFNYYKWSNALYATCYLTLENVPFLSHAEHHWKNAEFFGGGIIDTVDFLQKNEGYAVGLCWSKSGRLELVSRK